MYGFYPCGSRFGTSDVMKKFNAGGTFAKNELVKLTTGEIVIATGGSTNILGVASSAGTSTTDNVEVNITPGLVVIADTSSGSFAATYVGEYADFAGSTGAQIVDDSLHSSTIQNFLIWEYNPQGYGFDSDVSIGRFLLQETVYRV